MRPLMWTEEEMVKQQEEMQWESQSISLCHPDLLRPGFIYSVSIEQWNDAAHT